LFFQSSVPVPVRPTLAVANAGPNRPVWPPGVNVALVNLYNPLMPPPPAEIKDEGLKITGAAVEIDSIVDSGPVVVTVTPPDVAVVGVASDRAGVALLTTPIDVPEGVVVDVIGPVAIC
jgi:hypothetical protein